MKGNLEMVNCLKPNQSMFLWIYSEKLSKEMEWKTFKGNSCWYPNVEGGKVERGHCEKPHFYFLKVCRRLSFEILWIKKIKEHWLK